MFWTLRHSRDIKRDFLYRVREWATNLIKNEKQKVRRTTINYVESSPFGGKTLLKSHSGDEGDGDGVFLKQQGRRLEGIRRPRRR